MTNYILTNKIESVYDLGDLPNETVFTNSADEVWRKCEGFIESVYDHCADCAIQVPFGGLSPMQWVDGDYQKISIEYFNDKGPFEIVSLPWSEYEKVLKIAQMVK